MEFLPSNIKFYNLFSTLYSKLKSFDPETLGVSGLIAFCGVQGSGKTLTAVLYLKKLLDTYPKSICVTNISLNPAFFPSDRIIPYTGVDQIHSITNGNNGVIVFLDEIQIEFNSLESKIMNIPVFELVCQQRKQRKHIIGTTQVFGRLAKPLREQFKCAVLCNNYFGAFFTQKVYSAENVPYDDDIRTELSPKAFRFYFAKPQYFDMYDTYQVVKRIGGAING